MVPVTPAIVLPSTTALALRHPSAQMTTITRKDRHLRRAGYRVLRIPAELVMRDIAAAVELVRATLVTK